MGMGQTKLDPVDQIFFLSLLKYQPSMGTVPQF